MPLGPEVSWPNGFRQLDSESRRLLESGYGPARHGAEGYGPASYGGEGYGGEGYGGEGYGGEGYGSAGYAAPGSERGAYDYVDPGYGGAPAYGHGTGYRQPAMDDYGYGDPGYSDPSYEGPRSGSGGSTLPGGNRGSRAPGGPAPDDGSGYGRLSGYQVPEYRESSHRDFGYPAPSTGAAQIYPITGAQEALPATGPQPVADRWAAADPGYGSAGSQAYPEQWYDHPRLNDQRRPDPPAASDPRLEGMRYDELRYEEPAFAGSGFDEPLDADSWVEELRRSAPVYPERPGGPSGGTSGPDQRSADPQRRADPRVSGYGQQPGYPQAPAPDQAFGYGQGRDDRGGQGPQNPRMSAARDVRPSVPATPSDPAPSDPGYLGAPTSRVVVLTPPAIRRLEVPAEDRPLPGAAATGQLVSPAVRPGHGLDGPEITSSWPAQPHVDDLDDFEDFWREDDDDDYPGLFPNEAGAGDGRTGARAVGRGIGRRRGRSRDHRLWLALIGVVVVAAGAIFGILKFEFPSHGGPAHTMDIPNKIGSYVRTVDLEKQTHLAELRDEVIQMSAGQASGVVSGVYEAGDSAAGSTTQIIMVIEGHLANAAPATSIAAFTTKFPGATVVPAGALGGQAACVENGAGTSNPVSMCVWFDNDSFGEIVSPTMNAAQLATAMQTVRPAVELVAKK
jgi:hypothetical protein